MGLEIPKLLHPFTSHGVDFVKSSGNQLIAGCPFCGKAGHFYVQQDTGQWDCKTCGESGNVFTYLTKWARILHEETFRDQWRELARLRKLPVQAFKPWGLGWDGRQWVIPSVGAGGYALDLRLWHPKTGRIRSTAGCHTNLWGLDRLAKAKAGSTVWLCEGEWDAIAMQHLLRLNKKGQDIAVGVPGANTFKKDWVQYFAGHHVRIYYDNDEAGDNGSMKAGRYIQGTAASIQFANWPEHWGDGFDVRDFVAYGISIKADPADMLKKIESVLKKRHRREEDSTVGLAEGEESVSGQKALLEKIAVGSVKHPPSFKKVLSVFRKWITMSTEMEDALRICLAAGFAGNLPSNPLWIFLVGPSGCGKTMLLSAMRGSARTIFRSTLTPKSLVSGYERKEDPSLLPLMDGLCAVFKDWTELLSMHPTAREEVYSVLRGAFDGYVQKSFGNNVHREYHVHFSMLAGVTPVIHAHNQSSLGERFLMFEMFAGSGWEADDQIAAAIDNVESDIEKEESLRRTASEFLSREVSISMLPKLPTWIKNSVIALVQILARLRAVVEMEKFGTGVVLYRPTHEMGTRAGIQLTLLGRLLAWIEDREMNRKDYRILVKVSLDTGIGFNMDVVRALMQQGGSGLRTDVRVRTRISGTTLSRRIHDLIALGVLEEREATREELEGRSSSTRGIKPKMLVVCKQMKKFWLKARIEEFAPNMKIRKEIKP